jgi:hypothetical protein
MEELIIERLKQNDENQLEWVPFKYEYHPQKDFLIDPDNLDGEICKIGQLMLQYGEAHSLLQAQMERHKKEVEYVYAKFYLEYRSALAKEGERATAETLKSYVTINEHYQTVIQKYIETCKEHNLADSWYKNICKKADLLQSLLFKQTSEIKRGAY